MSEAVASSPPRRVLVVEDDPVFQDAIADAIRQLETPYRLHPFRTGAEALAFSRRPGIGAGLAFALVDLGLPDCNGVEVIEDLHTRFEGVPIMVISVVSAEAQVLRAIGAGAVGYILKGDSGLSMTRAIEQIMAGNYPISPKLARCLFRLARQTQKPGGQPGGLPALTPKELTLLEHLASGKSYGQAADAMEVRLSTVQTHIRALYRKLNVHSQTQAVSRARERGLLL